LLQREQLQAATYGTTFVIVMQKYTISMLYMCNQFMAIYVGLLSFIVSNYIVFSI
jgi:hypothetical protein